MANLTLLVKKPITQQRPNKGIVNAHNSSGPNYSRLSIEIICEESLHRG